MWITFTEKRSYVDQNLWQFHSLSGFANDYY